MRDLIGGIVIGCLIATPMTIALLHMARTRRHGIPDPTRGYYDED